MRVVVTGATGNVGSGVMSALVADSQIDEIVGVARRVPAATHPKVTWQRADVAAGDLVAIFAGADAVIHLAWLLQPVRDRAEMRRVNVGGTRRVLDAVAAAKVPALVVASSVGTYAVGPKDQAVDERWSTAGIDASLYSRQKSFVESLLDGAEANCPGLRIVRLRTSLVFQRAAASEIARLFLGPLVPRSLIRPALVPVVPAHPRLVFQAVHALDAGEAYRLAVRGDVRGAFNVAADPVINAQELALLLSARPVNVSRRLLRGAASVTWRLRLQPTSPGWVDLALGVPVMDTTRARSELGWVPVHSATEAVAELLEGFAHRSGRATPPLHPAASTTP